jgi:two-component system sensor histidine kinase PilS (NtrC family)
MTAGPPGPATAAPVSAGSRWPVRLSERRALLGGLLAFRTILALGLLLWTGLSGEALAGSATAVAALVLVVIVLTAVGGHTIYIRRVEPANGFLLLQAAADLAVVTGLVHAARDPATALAALYVVVIAAYAFLLPVAAGSLVAFAGSAVYLLSAWLSDPRGELPGGLWGQVAVFAVVFLLVATLGHRLRDTAAQRVRLESELRRVQFEASEVLRSITTGVITVEGQGRLAFANPAAEHLLGIEAAASVGEPILERLAEVAPELHAAIVRGIRQGRRVGRGEGVVRRPDGRVFPIGLSTATFEREEGGTPAVTALFTDLSELKQIQELHLRAERSEAVAALSASLAHEIRNPLASIRSSVEQLTLTATADEDERTLGGLIVRESDRLNRLLGEFLDFSRVRASEFSTVDLRLVAEEAVRLVREHPECAPGVELAVRGPPTQVEADADLLHRVVSNLVLNAVQACRANGKGAVTISVGPAAADRLPPGGADLDDAVLLEVRDTGPGIDPDVRARLFEPFVSRRPGGSGLGLAIVLRAVEAHRGLVLVESVPGRGARFSVYLPRRPYREGVA